jgi:hypothetical protein
LIINTGEGDKEEKKRIRRQVSKRRVLKSQYFKCWPKFQNALLTKMTRLLQRRVNVVVCDVDVVLFFVVVDVIIGLFY